MVQGSFIAVFIFHLPVAQTLDKDVVGILQDTYFFTSDVAQDTYSQARTRERMTGNQVLRHTQLATYAAYFIFEQQTQRFAKFQVHLFRQTTYVVVTLDNGTGDR